MTVVIEPLAPEWTADRFPRLGQHLIDLLSGLEPGDWRRPTICPGWQVRDIAAHLLDTACRRLATGEDGVGPEPPRAPIETYGALVEYLDRLNASWVEALRRVPPRYLVPWLSSVEPALAAAMAALDPEGRARFAVSWAGEEESANWFDVARELTERWHHQQQIRLAVGAAPLDEPWLSRPVLEAFLRALPFRYRGLEAPDGTAVAIEIEGRATYRFGLVRRAGDWRLGRLDAAAASGADGGFAARLRLGEETAWRLLTKGLDAEEARRRSRVEGDSALLAPFFATRAIMG